MVRVDPGRFDYINPFGAGRSRTHAGRQGCWGYWTIDQHSTHSRKAEAWVGRARNTGVFIRPCSTLQLLLHLIHRCLAMASRSPVGCTQVLGRNGCLGCRIARVSFPQPVRPLVPVRSCQLYIPLVLRVFQVALAYRGAFRMQLRLHVVMKWAARVEEDIPIR